MNSVYNGLYGLYTANIVPNGSLSSMIVLQWLWRPVSYPPGKHRHSLMSSHLMYFLCSAIYQYLYM